MLSKKLKKILIRSFKYGYIQLSVDENDTIDDIKYEAYCKIGFNYDDPDSSELIFAGIKLENDRKIKDYLLPTNAILNLVNNIKGGIIVFIKNGYGQLIPLEVTPKDKISSVKEQIQKIEGTLPSKQGLFFGGQVLLDENELQFYRIYHFAIIELKPSINSQASEQIKISFKLPSIEEPFQTMFV